ncbi:MAG: hydrogenase [Elusimicrobia bacterium CG_4_10_14_0_2_um_filter_56_8]|nr:MAG: hydrogenase [Elusimicrobia bacterium CG1_02_56_21]PJA12418.1 MAG: hydrogenase [Elusimicrobia bacterium CG_4_10_14_0_2_um_filter_56_8]
MIDIINNRLEQGYRTSSFPDGDPGLPERFRGRPLLKPELCSAGCAACAESCPTKAITPASAGGKKGALTLDTGKCLFCTECLAACPSGAVSFTKDHRLAASRRGDLLLSSNEARLAESLGEELRRLFGRSLKLRQVSAGGCGACEADLNVLNTVIYDLGRFGIQFVASPRHADGLIITGPVTRHMSEALKIAYAAIPEPRIVIASGACAISGGPYAGSEDQLGGASAVVPVDLFIPGCPPHPVTVLDGLLRLLGRIS